MICRILLDTRIVKGKLLHCLNVVYYSDDDAYTPGIDVAFPIDKLESMK